MNIRLILMLSLLGLVVGILSVVGVIRAGVESVVWLAIALIYGAVLARRAPGKFFLHGFLTGLIAGALAPLVQAAFLGQYLSHNPKAADTLKALPANLPAAVLIILAAPFTGAMLGLVTGLITWLWALMTRPKPAPAA